MAQLRHLSDSNQALLHSFHEALRNNGEASKGLARRFQEEFIQQIENRKPELLIDDGRRVVATDGSLQKHSNLKSCGAGAAVYTIEDSRLNKTAPLPISNSISIFTAESIAILAALAVAKRENYARLLIVSDSKTVVDKFNTFKDTGYLKSTANKLGTTPLERRIWTEIGQIARTLNVMIRHIRSHQTGEQTPLMLLNQKADSNAKAKMKQLLQGARAADGIALQPQ